MRSLETCTHIISRPKTYFIHFPLPKAYYHHYSSYYFFLFPWPWKDIVRSSKQLTQSGQYVFWHADSFVMNGQCMLMRIMMKWKKMLGILWQVLNSPCTYNFVSIRFYPGVAWGAWKHAPIIPLPNYHALILYDHPFWWHPKHFSPLLMGYWVTGLAFSMHNNV